MIFGGSGMDEEVVATGLDRLAVDMPEQRREHIAGRDQQDVLVDRIGLVGWLMEVRVDAAADDGDGWHSSFFERNMIAAGENAGSAGGFPSGLGPLDARILEIRDVAASGADGPGGRESARRSTARTRATSSRGLNGFVR